MLKKRTVHFDFRWQRASHLKNCEHRGPCRRYTGSLNKKCNFAKVSRRSAGPPGPVGSNRL